MAVKTQHKDYTAMLNKWQRCIDVCKGQEAVHNGGTLYLPMLKDQTKLDYDAYKLRSTFYNATWRTLVGLQGMIFRKPPKTQVASVVEPMLDNVDLSGTSLHMLALEVSEECLKLGRVGLFVDYPSVDTEHVTAADAKLQNLRPSMKVYSAPSIINWKTSTVKNKTVLSMVVLKECIDVPEDEFKSKEKIQYRVLDLYDVTTPDGVTKTVYRVRIFTINEKDQDVLESTVFPRINGQFLEEIPFFFVGVDDTSWEIDEPPLIDLVDVNLSHYRTTADYEHGCHFTGLPTPVISGYTPESTDEKFYIGSMSAWVFPNPMAKATYLEFTGQGLNALKENLDKKEGFMAILGARMLEAQTKAVEAANTATIHRTGEQSMLSSVAQAISIGITKALQAFSRFAGAGDTEVKFELNRDFFPIPMDALTLTAIIAGWQNQAYSYDTMFANLKKGEIVLPEQTAEDEQKAIAANPPPAPDVGTTPGSPSPNASPKAPKTKAAPATPAPTITQLQHGK